MSKKLVTLKMAQALENLRLKQLALTTARSQYNAAEQEFLRVHGSLQLKQAIRETLR